MSNTCTKMGDDQVYCSTWDNNDQRLQSRVLGQEKELALFFLDIRNYTQLMEIHPAYEVMYLVRHFLTEFVGVIKKFGGTVVEITGDNIYAVFGMETGIKTAVSSAIAAAQVVTGLTKRPELTFNVPACHTSLEIGIGIHKGEVIVGNSDLLGQSQLTVMGYPVNLAARLQVETKTLNNNLLVSEDAFALLDGDQGPYPANTVQLRGINSPVRVRLLGEAYPPCEINATTTTDDLQRYLAIAG